MTQIERGSYTYRGWLIVQDGSLWLMWPPGAPDGTLYTKAVTTLKQAKAYINKQLKAAS